MSALDPPLQQPPRRRGYWVPGLIALAALVLIGLILGAGDLSHPADRSINGDDIAQQISQGIQVQEKAASPPEVTCPGREPVHPGLAFECTSRSANGLQVVYVTEIDDRGEIRWSLTPPATSPGT